MTLANDILYNRIKNVERRLAGGEDVNELDEYGFTPLIEAAIADNVEMARLLLQHGAKVNTADVTGGTALHWAAENHNMELCELLLSQGADPNAYTRSSQSVLLKPLLRQQNDLKELLYQHGANLNFTKDYLSTKLLGHRFELSGRVDLLDPYGRFVEMDLEGFILEFTIQIILESLQYFKNNFAARKIRLHFNQVNLMIDAFRVAGELISYQQYRSNLKEKQSRINRLINRELLLLPIGYEGHAISFIRYGGYLAKCDRGENSLREHTVSIYKIKNSAAFDQEFIKHLLYKKHSKKFILHDLPKHLNLQLVDYLPLKSQISGNCSWANIEAAIPTIYYLLAGSDIHEAEIEEAVAAKETALKIDEEWAEWDKDFALHQCIENFYAASPARKASIAAILAAVLFQTCSYENDADQKRAAKILKILSISEYRYILDSYLKVYTASHKTSLGYNLTQLIDIYGN